MEPIYGKDFKIDYLGHDPEKKLIWSSKRELQNQAKMAGKKFGLSKP